MVASVAINFRFLVRLSRLSVRLTLPHSEHVHGPSAFASTAPFMSYQHFGHRSRPRGLSQNIAHRNSAPPVKPSAIATAFQMSVGESCTAISLLGHTLGAASLKRHSALDTGRHYTRSGTTTHAQRNGRRPRLGWSSLETPEK